MVLLTTVFEFVGGVVCSAVAVGVIYMSFKTVYDYIFNQKDIIVYKSSNVKCSRCGMTYSIKANGHKKSTYDAFCPFCGRQTYLMSPDVKANIDKDKSNE